MLYIYTIQLNLHITESRGSQVFVVFICKVLLYPGYFKFLIEICIVMQTLPWFEHVFARTMWKIKHFPAIMSLFSGWSEIVFSENLVIQN